MKKVLLVRPDKAGDALKTLPVLRALLQQNLDFEYHLLASAHNASLFEFEEGFQLHTLPKNWETLSAADLQKYIRENVNENFDVSILLPCDTFAENERLQALIPAAKKLGSLPENLSPAYREETQNIATIVGNALAVELIPFIYEVPRAPVFSVEDEEEARAKMGEKAGDWLGFCPFAGTAHRTHPFKSWLKLIRKVTKAHSFEKYFIFGTESVREEMLKLKSVAVDPSKVDLCFPSSFRTLGAYLKHLDGIVAVDSGPLHLAQSLNIPSLGILSGGDVERWFKRIQPHDLLIKRGLLSRYPSVFEIFRAFKAWQA